MIDATDLLEFFYDESSGTGVLRCVPCFQFHCLTKVHCKSMTPLKALQKLKPSNGKGSLATGLFLKQATTRLLIEGHNQSWYRDKKLCIDHLTLIGEGSITHKKAMDEYKKNKCQQSRSVTAATNIFRASIVDIKLGAAGLHLETLLSLLSLCGVDIGSIGHSRKHFNTIMYCLEKSIDERCAKWLSTPLPSAGLPPHFWVTIDKGTPSRTTNQAILVVGRDKKGKPCPMPVDAPSVYSEFEAATYPKLAEMIVTTISEKFSDDVLTRICGIAADGPYQAIGFRETFLEMLNITDAEDTNLALPVTWDPAHLINLGVTDIKDANTESGKHFKRFIKRCNVFNTILAHGKGFAFLQMTDSTARRPVSYATQRFASSSYEQWLKIEKSYDSYWKAFEHLYPNRIEEEEYQYQIAGADFVSDLLACLDTLEPVVDLMLRVQSLDAPIWKLKSWWPTVKTGIQFMIDNDSFPRVDKHGILNPGDEFKGVRLLEGWLFEECEGTGRDKLYKWSTRDTEDVSTDRIRFAKDILESINNRLDDVISQDHLKVLEVFDASRLVQIQCGKRTDDSVIRDVDDSSYEEYGVIECKKLMNVVSKMKHIKENEINFDERMAHRYMMTIKDAVFAGIWNNLCPHWFINSLTNSPLDLAESVSFLEVKLLSSDSFESTFQLRLSDGKIFSCRLHEQSVYESFYSDEDIYNIAKSPSCILIDIALAKGGPEAIAESFYATMRSQQQTGGQSNEVLVRRSKISWCLPALRLCNGIIKDSVKTYFEGDEKVKPHRSNIFYSLRAKEYNVSKVIDRIDNVEGRCSFLI